MGREELILLRLELLSLLDCVNNINDQVSMS
jgi:hypothetical protein